MALPFATTRFGVSLVPPLIDGAALLAVTLFPPDGVVGSRTRLFRRSVHVVPVVGRRPSA